MVQQMSGESQGNTSLAKVKLDGVNQVPALLDGKSVRKSVHIHREMVPMVDQENWNSSPNIGNSMTESYSESDPSRALRPRKSARLSMSTSHKSKKFIDTNTEDIVKKSPELETDNNEWNKR